MPLKQTLPLGTNPDVNIPEPVAADSDHPPRDSLVQEIRSGVGSTLMSTAKECPLAKNAYDLVPKLLNEIILCEMDLSGEKDGNKRYEIVDAHRAAFTRVLRDNEKKFREIGLYILLWRLARTYDWNERLGRMELHNVVLKQLPDEEMAKLDSGVPWVESTDTPTSSQKRNNLDRNSLHILEYSDTIPSANMQAFFVNLLTNISDCGDQIRQIKQDNGERSKEYAIADVRKTAHLRMILDPKTRKALTEAGIFEELKAICRKCSWRTEEGRFKLAEKIANLREKTEF